MATATVVATYIEHGMACMEVAVDEGQNDVNKRASVTAYTGRVPMDAAWQALSGPDKKAALVAAVKAARDAQVAPVVAAPTITGTVTV